MSDDDELFRLLREAQFILIKHPIAAQAAFRALVAEGRAFAETPEGAKWKKRLAGSDLIRRGRVVWETATLNLLEEKPPSVLPGKLLDAFVALTSLPDLEPNLSRLFEDDGDHGDANHS